MVHLISVVTQHARQSGASQYAQLLPSESGGRHITLVPVAVALPQQTKLSGNQAVESRTHGRAVQRSLRQSPRQEVNLCHISGGRKLTFYLRL